MRKCELFITVTNTLTLSYLLLGNSSVKSLHTAVYDIASWLKNGVIIDPSAVARIVKRDLVANKKLDVAGATIILPAACYNEAFIMVENKGKKVNLDTYFKKTYYKQGAVNTETEYPDWTKLGDTTVSTKDGVQTGQLCLVSRLNKTIAEPIIAAFFDEGIPLRAALSTVFCMNNIGTFYSKLSDDFGKMIVHMDDRKTNVVIEQRGTPLIYKELKYGIQDLAEALSARSSMTVSIALELLRDVGFNSNVNLETYFGVSEAAPDVSSAASKLTKDVAYSIDAELNYEEEEDEDEEEYSTVVANDADIETIEQDGLTMLDFDNEPSMFSAEETESSYDRVDSGSKDFKANENSEEIDFTTDESEEMDEEELIGTINALKRRSEAETLSNVSSILASIKDREGTSQEVEQSEEDYEEDFEESDDDFEESEEAFFNAVSNENSKKRGFKFGKGKADKKKPAKKAKEKKSLFGKGKGKGKNRDDINTDYATVKPKYRAPKTANDLAAILADYDMDIATYKAVIVKFLSPMIPQLKLFKETFAMEYGSEVEQLQVTSHSVQEFDTLLARIVDCTLTQPVFKENDVTQGAKVMVSNISDTLPAQADLNIGGAIGLVSTKGGKR